MKYQTVKKQSGAVLAISLVLLTAITVLAVISMQRAGLQTRITGNILHREMLFNSAMNEQESWFYQLKTADTGDAVLSEPIRSFTVNGDGSRTYTPVTLDADNTVPGTTKARPIQTQNELLLLGAIEGKISLAQGQESGDRVLFRYELQSESAIGRIEGRSMDETQITGMSFPGLNTSKNSLYAAP
jgi:Tfp pilus assembly protein PilX